MSALHDGCCPDCCAVLRCQPGAGCRARRTADKRMVGRLAEYWSYERNAWLRLQEATLDSIVVISALVDRLNAGWTLSDAQRSRRHNSATRRAPTEGAGWIDLLAEMAQLSADRVSAHRVVPNGRLMHAGQLAQNAIEREAQSADESTRAQWNAEGLLSRPATVGECASRGLGTVRACPWISCEHHLGVVHNSKGIIVRDNVAQTCALAVAARGPQTQRSVARAMGLSRQRVSQIEEQALADKQIRRQLEVVR